MGEAIRRVVLDTLKREEAGAKATQESLKWLQENKEEVQVGSFQEHAMGNILGFEDKPKVEEKTNEGPVEVVNYDLDEGHMGVSCIIPNLYCSSVHVAQNLERLREFKVKAVLNVTVECHNEFEASGEFTYMKIKLADKLGQQMNKYLGPAADFIAEHIGDDSAVLVHDLFGVTRAPCMIMAYLMKHKGMDLWHAYAQTIANRRSINPSKYFWEHLIEFELTLFETNSLKLNIEFEACKEVVTVVPVKKKKKKKSKKKKRKAGSLIFKDAEAEAKRRKEEEEKARSTYHERFDQYCAYFIRDGEGMKPISKDQKSHMKWRS